jgi:hemolysin activation/secretion protein
MKKYIFIILSLIVIPVYAFSQAGNMAASDVNRIQDELFEQQKKAQIRQAQKNYLESKAQVVKEKETLSDEEKRQANEKVLKINKIFFAPSSVLPASLFENLRTKYEGQFLSVNDIYDILDTINNTYLL